MPGGTTLPGETVRGCRGSPGATMFGGVTPVPLGEMMFGLPGTTGRIGPSGDRGAFVGARCTVVGEEATPVDVRPAGLTCAKAATPVSKTKKPTRRMRLSLLLDPPNAARLVVFFT